MTYAKSVDPRRDGVNVTVTLLDTWLYELVKRVDTLDADHKSEISALKNRISELEKSLIEKDAAIDELKVKLSNSPPLEVTSELHKTIEETARQVAKTELTSRGLNTDNINFNLNTVAAINNERKEAAKRERNVICFGLQPADTPENDKESTYELVSALKLERADVQRIVRFDNSKKTRTDRPNPVLIEFKSVELRDRAFKGAKELKGNERFLGVSISPDMTPNERILLKREVEECDRLNKTLETNSPFRWGIRNRTRQKIDVTTKRIYKTPIPNNEQNSNAN